MRGRFVIDLAAEPLSGAEPQGRDQGAFAARRLDCHRRRGVELNEVRAQRARPRLKLRRIILVGEPLGNECRQGSEET
jgi:hypothetical protein